MAIESGPFQGTKLTGEDTKRFIRHMEEDKPNPAARASLTRGREVFCKMQRGETFSLRQRSNNVHVSVLLNA